MKLYFSFPEEVYRKRRRELVRTAKKTVPGLHAAHMDEHFALAFTLPENAPYDAAEQLVCAWEALGIASRRIDPSELPPPPICMSELAGNRPRTVRLSVFLVSLISVALVVGVLTFALTSAFGRLHPTGGTLGTTEGSGEDYYGKISLIDQIFKQYSLYDTDGKLLLDEMLKAYAAATGDRYAAYYTAEEYAALIAENTAQMVGIGITVIEDAAAGGARIIAVSPSSPAEAAGVLAGDILVSAGEGEAMVSYAGGGYDLLLSALRGEEGSLAVFSVRRGEEELRFSVARTKIESVSVSGRVYSGDATVGVVRIHQFDISTPGQFEAVMDDLIAKGCTSFVFDVRNNPGGDSKSICGVLSYFLAEGDMIFTTTTKDGTVTENRVRAVTYTGDYAPCSVERADIGKYRGYPLAVLVNGNTASAAELFTATLRDYRLATVVGETTFGKGIIQSIYSLAPYGYTGGVKLTVGYYSPPCGVNYDGVGIAPDIAASLSGEAAGKNPSLLTDEEDTQLAAAVGACKS